MRDPIRQPRMFWAVVLVFLTLFTWLFADVLFQDHQFAFRDVGHYYYPLYEFLHTAWTEGGLPTFHPYENLGARPIADPACAWFYPGKLVFWLPIGYPWAFKLYLLGHFLLAATGLYRAARSLLGCGPCSAMLGTLSYTFGGYLLMQHTNPIYLVGGAWLPWGFLAAGRMFCRHRRQWRYAIGFGLVVAMMILGGDPQTAYNLILMAVGLAFLLVWRARKKAKRFGPGDLKDREKDRAFFRRPKLTSLFAVAGLVAFAVAAVQVIPASRQTAGSHRAEHQTARSIYEIPQTVRLARASGEDPTEPVLDGLLCRRFPPDGHHRLVYRYSFGPWQLAEFAWPGFSGKMYPTHRRWLNAFGPQGRIWTPSVYMGLIPLVFALGVIRFRRGRSIAVWLSWGLVFSILAAFGWYGLGWAIRQVGIWLGVDANRWLFGAPVGSPYWLMTVFLPGYLYFRYPAKWLVIASATLALLSAYGAERVFREKGARRTRRIQAVLGILIGLSLVGFLVLGFGRSWWERGTSEIGSNVLFGPFDAAGAWRDLIESFAQTALVGLLGLGLLIGLKKGASASNRQKWLLGMVVLTAVDLAVAGRVLITTAPQPIWKTPSRFALAIRDDAARRGLVEPIRIFREPGFLPEHFGETASADRIAESICWDRATLYPKHHLPYRLAIVNVYGSTMTADHHRLLAETNCDAVMEATGARYAILPESVDPRREFTNRRWVPIDRYEGARLWFRAGSVSFELEKESSNR